MTSTQDNSSIILQTNRLKVEVARPGAVYAGSRFDWTGFITQVTLDGQHRFCVPESMVPGRGSGGNGLCNEFGIHEPIGYDDAKVGEKFPKLGVGLLTRPDEKPYDFFRPYSIEPFPVQIDATAECVTFTVEPLACRGYAARLVKRIALKENHLTVDYRLENVGQKPIETTEYYHNFIGIDGYTIGPDYVLRLPYPIRFVETQEIFAVNGSELSWRWQPEGDFYGQPKGFTVEPPHRWELVHQPSGAGVREESRFKVERVALWGTTHVASPEVFVKVSVAPGQTQTWSREYEFFS